MSSDHDRTHQLVTNLDRGAIEGRLVAVRNAAQASNLGELASMLSGVEGQPRAAIEQRVRSALRWLADKPQHNNLRGQLEVLELNLPNLK